MSTNPIHRATLLPTAASEPSAERRASHQEPPAITQDGLAVNNSGAGRSFPDFTDARRWRPGSQALSGVTANARITRSYHELDRRMTAFLGEDALPNWTTFGKYASRTAGEQIRQLEDVMNAFDGKADGGWGDLLSDVIRHPIQRSKQAWIMASNQHRGPDFLKNVAALRKALVHGNTEIMKDIGPAYDAFLSAEEQGRDGLAALRAAGYGSAPKDPQNFILQAFEKYAEARVIGQQIATLKGKLGPTVAADSGGPAAFVQGATPEQTAAGTHICELHQRQRHLMVEGNLLLGFHEQYLSLQRPEIFEDPAVAKLMAKFSRHMSMHDANGDHPLLKRGGNWANFADRMGLREAGPADSPAEIFTLRDVKGETRRYVVDDRAEDTIAGYFETFTYRGPSADELVKNQPKSLHMRLDRSPLDRLKSWLGWDKGERWRQ